MNELLDFLTFSSTHSLILWRQQKSACKSHQSRWEPAIISFRCKGWRVGEKRAKEVRRLGPILRWVTALSRQRSESSCIEQKAAKHKSKGWVQHRLVESAFCLVSPSSESCALLCFFTRVLSGVNSLKEAKLEPISPVEVPRFSFNIFSSSSPQAHNCGCT